MGDDPDGDLNDQIVTLKRIDRSVNPPKDTVELIEMTNEDRKNAAMWNAATKHTPSLPRIGRLIHVRGYDKCRAAIVTGEGENWRTEEPSVYIEIFAPNLKPQEAILFTNEGWHYVDECTS